MPHKFRKTATLGAVLFFGLASCADLDVVNPNAPDADLALANPADVVNLVQGSFRQWWMGNHDPSGPAHVIANMSFQQSSWPANFGMVNYSRLPRGPIVNVGLQAFYANVVNGVWFRNYRSLFAVAQGLKALEDPELSGELSATELRRVQAFGRFMQGLSHGTLALFYEEAYILDETNVEGTRDATGAAIEQPVVSYTALLDAALGYFDEAIALSEGLSGADAFTIPASWMSVSVSSDQLAELAHFMKARHRANVARTPAERQAVNWDAVIADLDAGLDQWNMEYPQSFNPTPTGFWNDVLGRSTLSYIGWAQASYMILGMADQSGNYQEWLSVSPPESRHPDLSGGPFLIVTPDQRFAQGSTAAEQQAGQTTSTIVQFNGGALGLPPNNWGQPARGTQRWSYYRTNWGDGHVFLGVTSIPEVTPHEARLLRAEAHYWRGELQEAADLINVTRVDRGGLSPANPLLPDQGNTSCVPKLPNESCGDLLEMLKWEKRLHTGFLGVNANSWYFDGRGWGDLYAGTPLHLPLPCDEHQLFGRTCSTTGGMGGNGASPGSVYNWPDEM